MKKGILAAVIAALVAMGAWYALSPGMAMRSLREAALAGDKEELKERVDFPAIRESLKSQMRAVMTAEIAKAGKDNPFAALGAAFAMSIADGMIDGIVSPDGIKVMVEQGKMKGPSDSGTEQPKEVEWTIERQGFSHFAAHPVVAGDQKAPSLVFKRDGLGWDLVDIEVPTEQGSGK